MATDPISSIWHASNARLGLLGYLVMVGAAATVNGCLGKEGEGGGSYNEWCNLAQPEIQISILKRFYTLGIKKW